MPDVNQYTLTQKELLEALIQKCGVHEGKWTILVNFGFSAGNFGPTINEAYPGAIVAISNVGIQRATDEVPEALLLDAAVVNPAKKDKQRS